jgi:hypothetical protein
METMSGFIATPSMRYIEQLETRIAELEKKLDTHRHHYVKPGPMRAVSGRTGLPINDPDDAEQTAT